MSYQNKSVASLITSYKTKKQPYINYVQNLAALAVQLRELKEGESWSFGPTDGELCEHYTYVYLNPLKPGKYTYACPSGKVVTFKFEPFYVGKGKGGRVDDHNNQAIKLKYVSGNHGHKINTFVAIMNAGFDPTDYRHVTDSRQSDWMARAFEIDLIAGIGRHNTKTGPLTNGTDGGDGGSGHVQSTELRARRSAIMKGKNLGKTHSKRPESRASYVRAAKARKKLECPHCGKHTACNVAHQFHFANCMDNPNVTEDARSRRTQSKDSKAKIREFRRNEPIRVCSHCGRSGQGPNMDRWHFNRCKYK